MMSSDSSCASDSTISTPSCGAGDDEVELSSASRCAAWSGFSTYWPSIHVADARGGDRAEEGNAGQRQRGGAADQGDDVRVVLEVMADSTVAITWISLRKPVRKQRADGTVDQAGDQRLVLVRASFPLEEAAGDPCRPRRPSPGSSR